MNKTNQQPPQLKSTNADIGGRIHFIKQMYSDDKLAPFVDFDQCNTEIVENRTSSNDIRKIMTKKKINFHDIITGIGSKIQYIKSGTTGHTFKGITYDEEDQTRELSNYAIKVVAYPIGMKGDNYGNIHDIRRPENAELMMLRVLSYFVVNQQTPHIVLPIGTFNTDIRTFIALAKNKMVENKRYDQFVKRYRQSEYHSEVSVLISEWANGGDLMEYINNNYKTMKLKEWRAIFFQIISVLCIIQQKYPGFRHNDLKPNNILVQNIEVNDRKKLFKYDININQEKYEFIVPNIGMQIKLWDFDFACIPGIVDNAKVNAEWTDGINVRPIQNKYYDLHYFFNTLTNKPFFANFWDKREIHPSVKQFIRDIIPEQYREFDKKIVEVDENGEEHVIQKIISDKGRYLLNEEFTTPEKILIEHPFFDKMRPDYCKVRRKTTNS